MNWNSRHFSEIPSYAEALESYYRNGPPADWQARFVSAYASMHPWEDFAESFALYLDMVDILDTADHTDVLALPQQRSELDEMISQYLKLGIAANELNRSMGLIDLLPELLTQPVREKLAFVDAMVCSVARATKTVSGGAIGNVTA